MELSKGNRIYSKEIETVMNNANVSPPKKNETCHFSSSATTNYLLAQTTSQNRLEMERLTTNMCESDSSKKMFVIDTKQLQKQTHAMMEMEIVC